MSKNKEYIASGDKDGLINIWKVEVVEDECGEDFVNSSESPKRRQNQSQRVSLKLHMRHQGTGSI